MSENRRQKKGNALRKRPGTRPDGGTDQRGGVLAAKPEGDVAFDRWLEDKLRNSYSSVLEEPIPDDLLRLLEQKLKE